MESAPGQGGMPTETHIGVPAGSEWLIPEAQMLLRPVLDNSPEASYGDISAPPFSASLETSTQANSAPTPNPDPAAQFLTIERIPLAVAHQATPPGGGGGGRGPR